MLLLGPVWTHGSFFFNSACNILEDSATFLQNKTIKEKNPKTLKFLNLCHFYCIDIYNELVEMYRKTHIITAVNCSYQLSEKRPNLYKWFYIRRRPGGSAVPLLFLCEECHHRTAKKGGEEHRLWVRGMDCSVLCLVEVDSWL